MVKIKGWTKISSGHIDNIYEWQNDITKQRVLYYPYGLTLKYKLIIEGRHGIQEGIVSNKHSANFGAMKFMKAHPKG